ncbi:MAG: glutathione S-transferase N-terminal domain-containing protein [Pseudomonadales bacterium]
MIELYTAATPNGWKISALLEELELPYEVTHIDIGTGAQHEEAFLAINPNGKIPALIDRGNNDLAIFESGAIMMYLAEKTGKLLPTETAARYKVIQWLMFQMAGVGPMQGQANVFFRYFPEKIQPAIDRYQHECRRLFTVMDKQLADNEFIAGELSIADFALWSWARIYFWAGIDIDGLEHFARWLNTMETRPSCQRGADVPTKIDFADILNDEESAAKAVKTAQAMLVK